MDSKHTSELCAAVKAGDADRAKRAIEAGESVVSGKVEGVDKPLVIWAVDAESAECLRVLLAAGAQVDARGDAGETALMRVMSTANRECMRLLLDAGADVNAKDLFGMTPAMWAARFGPRDHTFIEALVGAGADLRTTDAMRRTAATHAKIGGLPEISALIKAHIAAVDERKRLARALSASSSQKQPRSLRV